MKSTLLGLLTFSLGFGTFTYSQAAEADLAIRAQAILKENCYRCHGQDGTAKGGFGYVLDRERLLSHGKLTAGKPDESELFQRVAKGEMPPKQQPRPSVEDVTVLRRWIEAGAPAARTTEEARAFLSDTDLLRQMLADAQTFGPRQRRFLRYLTLAHRYNAGASDEELQSTRAAVAKLVNSLSWHPRLTAPQPIDPAATILRLDLRDYQWNARTWERLQTVYPYRVGSDRPEARALAAATGCEQPQLRADWFVATASRPPLYHDLLQLPASDRELERLLRVDVLTNWQEENVARAGFNGSGVSRNNRLIERHDAAYGAYWRSYDFSDNVERQNLFEHPLGPLPGQSSFVPAGGEVIFHLPNGLQGYLLVNGEGRRIDRAPVEIVSDPQRPDRVVETGLSCMSCHVRGLLPKTDLVRAHVLKNRHAFSAADAAAVRALYPPEASMRTLMDEDNGRFVRALKRLDISPDEPEPIATVAQRYEAALDLAAAAAETGLPEDEFAKRLRASAELARTFGSVLVKGGTVQRSTVQQSFVELLHGLGPVTVSSGRDSPTAVLPFAGHSERITSIVFSADGRRALSGSEDRTLRLWDVATGTGLQRFAGHTDEVLCVALAPDGRYAISGGRDKTVRLWDISSGTEWRCLRGHTDQVTSVAFCPDGRGVVSGSVDHTIRIWSVENGQQLRQLNGHTQQVRALAVAADGQHLLSGSFDGTVRWWDLETGREITRCDGHTRPVHAVALSADGRRALSGGEDQTVRLWDLETGKEQQRFTQPTGTVIALAFLGDGQSVAAGSSQYRTAGQPVRVWDLKTGKQRQAYGDDGSVWSVAFHPAGNLALSGTSEKTLRRWDLSR
jgi:mono/diheme cytochrome c family protein